MQTPYESYVAFSKQLGVAEILSEEEWNFRRYRSHRYAPIKRRQIDQAASTPENETGHSTTLLEKV